jgi:broad specificity polyphosphatase/5'/3'-nucleotidase SurE
MALNQLQADKDTYTGQAAASLQGALLQAGQQYSDAGSYDSGVRMRAQGQQSVQNAYNLQGQNISNAYQVSQQNLQGNYFRNIEIPLQESNENIELTNQYQNSLQQQAAQDYANNVANYNYTAQSNIGAPPGEDQTAFNNQISSLLPYVNSNIPSTSQALTNIQSGV